MITSTSIQKHRDKEQIDEAASEFQVISPGSLPRVNHVLNTRHIADVEMLPAAVGWDGVIFVRPKITLSEVSSSCCDGWWEMVEKNLNDGDDEVGNITEFVFVEIEVG